MASRFGVLTRISKKVGNWIKPKTVAGSETTAQGMVLAPLGELSSAFFEVSDDRLDVYRDAEEMDDTVDEVAAALDILSDNAVNAEGGAQGAFWLIFKKGAPEVITLIEGTLRQVRWAEKAYAIARDTILYGDSFLQYVVGLKDMRVLRLMYMPPASMRRNEDKAGLLLEGTDPGEAAFEQYNPGTTQRIAWFYPWQIEHMRWNRSGARKYGRSLLRTARTPWKKWQAMEEALVINWLTRAFARLLFILDITNKTPKEAEAYIRAFAKSLTTRQIASGVKGEEQLSVVKDIYIGRTMHRESGRAYPGLTDVKVLDTSSSGFINLSPIEYYQNKVITSLRVPKAHLGLERDVNAKATLQAQDKRFVRVIQRVQSMLSQAIDHTIQLQLALLSIDPDSVEYQIKWPRPSWADMLEESQALKNFVAADEVLLDRGIIDDDYVRKQHLRMPQDEIDDLKPMPTKVDKEDN